MNFSEALIFLKKGVYLTRSGWNGKNLCVYIFYPSVSSLSPTQLEENSYINAHFRIWNIDRKTVDAWVPSVSDLLANDWEISNVVSNGSYKGYFPPTLEQTAQRILKDFLKFLIRNGNISGHDLKIEIDLAILQFIQAKGYEH